MSYYTERHKMRTPMHRTYKIELMEYDVLLNVCEKYYENIAWRFPNNNGNLDSCLGIDSEKMVRYFWYEIPDLYGLDFHTIAYAMDNCFYIKDNPEKFQAFAIFDLIEFIYDNCKDIYAKIWDEYSNNFEIRFNYTGQAKKNFRKDINRSFESTGLLYTLTEDGKVERIFDDGILDNTLLDTISIVKEDGLKQLLNDAISKHSSPHPEDIRDSVEKIWDALERLKTYYVSLNKKESVTQIIKDISGESEELRVVFEAEFKALTDIGNNFRIRHHETNRNDITDINHYDYFFNRCWSLIVLSIKYLDEVKQ